MSILVVFNLNKPNNLGNPFPPSVLASDWLKNLNSFMEQYIYNAPAHFNITMLLLPDQAAFDKFLSLKCTDPALLADIETWKSTHNISYTLTAYNLDTANQISCTPVW